MISEKYWSKLNNAQRKHLQALGYNTDEHLLETARYFMIDGMDAQYRPYTVYRKNYPMFDQIYKAIGIY